jgi:acylphosphatase
MEKVAVKLLISGRVQGVWYRGSTLEAAEAIGVTGWVRNLRDGRVEVFAEGPKSKVEELIAWCRHGPPFARVTEVEKHWREPEGFKDFQTRYDY